MLGFEHYIFAAFIAAIVFALLFWYKKTPRATLPRKESEMLAEKEAKLFKLYQNLEDMMDSFESYVDQETAQIGKQSESIRQAEIRVDELADRIEKAINNTEDKFNQATDAADKAEILAADVTTELRKLRTEARDAADRAEAAQAAHAEIIARAARKRPERDEADAPPARQERGPQVQAVDAAESKERVLRKVAPVVARPAEGEEQQHVFERPEPVQAADTDLPFTPIAGGGNASDIRAQLVKKIAAARKHREEEAARAAAASQPMAASQAVADIQPMAMQPAAAQAGFDTALPEYEASSDALNVVGNVAAKYQSYSRPAQVQQGAEMDHVLAATAGTVKKASFPKEGGDDSKETSRKQQVLELHNGGMTAEEISRELGVAKGAISFILDLQGKLQ